MGRKKKEQQANLTENTRVKLNEVLSDSNKFDYKSIEELVWGDIPYFISLFPWFDYAISAYEAGRYGGIPGTRMTEIVGPESSGKSTLADILIANVQKRNGYGIIADYEDAHQERRMIELGVDPDYVTFIQPKETINGIELLSLEDFFDGTEEAVAKIRSADPNGPILAVCDSLAAAHLGKHLKEDVSKEDIAEYDLLNMKENSEKPMFLSANLSKFLGRMTRRNVTVLIINQIRLKPGVVFGNPEYAPGGKAVPFYSSLVITLSSGTLITPENDFLRTHRDPDAIGLETTFKIKKNKVAKRVNDGKYKLYFDDRGVVAEENFLDLIKDRNVVAWCDELDKAGHSWSWRGERLGKSKKETIKALIDNKELFEDMKQTIFGSKEDKNGNKQSIGTTEN